MSGFVAYHAAATVRASPNFGPRRGVGAPDMILLHYTGMESGEAAETWLCSPESQVSSHYLVHEDGRVVQMVRERDRAWHAGRSAWKGETDVNSLSVGIEIVNPGHVFGYPDFSPVQIDAVIALCRDVAARHGVAPERVLAHSDVAPGRKIDPGEKFPWQRLAASGLGIWATEPKVTHGPVLEVGGRGEKVETWQSMLEEYGYAIEINGVFDDRTRVVTEAFQRHFRPALVDGRADPATVLTLRSLMDSLGRPSA